jgi:hypothetical protein
LSLSLTPPSQRKCWRFWTHSRDDHAAGVGHHVGDDVDVLLAEDLVGGRGGGAVSALEDDLAVHVVGVLLVNHAAEGRRDEDVAGDRDEVGGRQRLPALELDQLASVVNVLVEGVRVDARVAADRPAGIGDADHLGPELLHDPGRPRATLP